MLNLDGRSSAIPQLDLNNLEEKRGNASRDQGGRGSENHEGEGGTIGTKDTSLREGGKFVRRGEDRDERIEKLRRESRREAKARREQWIGLPR